MRKYLLLLFVFGVALTNRSFSQSRGTVKGVVTDTASGKQGMSNATISIAPLAGDSTQAEFTVSGKGGTFSLRAVKTGQYKLLITFEGYNAVDQRVNMPDAGGIIDLGTIVMSRADKMLAEGAIQRPPMGVKK